MRCFRSRLGAQPKPAQKCDTLAVIEKCDSPLECKESFAKTRVKVKGKIPMTVEDVKAEFGGFVESVKQKIPQETLVDSLVDSIVISELLKYCPGRANSDVLKIIPGENEVWKNKEAVEEARAKIAKIGTNNTQKKSVIRGRFTMRRKSAPVSPPVVLKEPKSILVETPKQRQKIRKVHFVPMKGDKIPKGAQIFDSEKAKKEAVLRSDKRRQLLMIQTAIFMQIREQNRLARSAITKSQPRRCSIDDSLDCLLNLHNMVPTLPQKMRRSSSPSLQTKSSSASTSHASRVISNARRMKAAKREMNTTI